MLASQLDFFLPQEQIAQTPIEPRDASRLLVLRRNGGGVEHRTMQDFPDLLRPDDLLIFNDTRVLRARLRGHRPTGGQVEVLLLKERARNLWECLLKPSARIKTGTQFSIHGSGGSDGAALLPAVARERNEDGWLVEFLPPSGQDLRDLLPEVGEVPLPPYIHATAPEERYQTVYARPASSGEGLDSAAAPTAGLHFTPEMLRDLPQRGVSTAFVTLAVGVGTFRPVQAENLDEHRMHEEEYFVPPGTAEAIAKQRERGGRVIAVGTTTVRTLESAANPDGTVRSGLGSTGIFIRPGYGFTVVDALLTNFHLPRSTLLALVAAFVEQGDLATPDGGVGTLLSAYATAVSEGYRFFSFGDAMYIE